MNLKDVVAVMRDTPLFRNIDPKRLKMFAMLGETLSYRTGERLFEKGDDGDAAYVVLEGEVDVLIPIGGDEVSVAALGAKQIFGEMAVLCDQPRSTAIAAKTDLKVLRIDRKSLLEMLREFPDISLEFVKVLADRLEATSRQLAEARGV
ncbi:MAG: cyclic nucleotide-binding domain-containing protein [Pseudomonadota bacterium]